MRIGLMAWALVGVSLALGGCGTPKPARAASVIVYRSFVPAYYQRYYEGALIDELGIPPDTDDLSDSQFLELEAKLRRASLVWAEAPNEVLRLGEAEFTFGANHLTEVKGRSWLLPEAVIERRVEQRGTYKREGSQLILTFEGEDGNTYVIRAQLEQDLIVFHSHRNMGPLFGTSVLRRED